MKINLGSGNMLKKGYINIDVQELKLMQEDKEYPYLNINAQDITSYFKESSVDEVYSCQFFEHLTHLEITELLWKIWNILKPEGQLKIIVPNIIEQLLAYQRRFKQGNYSDLDIMHLKVFDSPKEAYGHNTAWFREVGEYYLLREKLYSIEEIQELKEDNSLLFIAKPIK